MTCWCMMRSVSANRWPTPNTSISMWTPSTVWLSSGCFPAIPPSATAPFTRPTTALSISCGASAGIAASRCCLSINATASYWCLNPPCGRTRNTAGCCRRSSIPHFPLWRRKGSSPWRPSASAAAMPMPPACGRASMKPAGLPPAEWECRSRGRCAPPAPGRPRTPETASGPYPGPVHRPPCRR